MLNWAEFTQRIPAAASIGMHLDRMGRQQIEENRGFVEVLMECVLYCSQHGIAFRAHDESENVLNPGNLRCLLKMMSRHTPTPVVKKRLQECHNATWLSAAFQNDIIKFLATEVRLMIHQKLDQAQYYTVLADETKDVSKAEQLSIAFWYVHGCHTVERFTGYIHAVDLRASALTEYIHSKLTDFHLDLNKMVSQCYDVVSVISGCNAGVQTMI